MRRAAIILSIVVLLAVAGCSGAVGGQISSKSAHTPLPAATVKVGSTSVVTDTAGHFSIAKVNTGSPLVAVHAAGFGPYRGTLEVQRGDNTLNVVLEDGTVQGALKENAEVRESIAKAHVTIAGKTATLTQGGHFSATGVPVGSQTLVVSAPGHATYTKEIDIAPGDNQVTAVLDLTPVETYMRYYLSYRFGRYRDAYRILHPDVRQHYSYKKFVKDMKGEITLGVSVLGTHTLSKWHPSFAHNTYYHVVAVDRAYRYQDAWGKWTDNTTHHWVQNNGRWYLIWDWTN